MAQTDTNKAGELYGQLLMILRDLTDEDKPAADWETHLYQKAINAILALHQAELDKAVLAALAKHVLAGMPELTVRQQEYITEVLEQLREELAKYNETV